MTNIEAIIQGMPADIQVLVKVPSLLIGEEHIGRVFWKENKVPRELVIPLVELIKNGVSEEDIDAAKLKLENDDLKKQNQGLREEIDIIEAQAKEAEDKHKALKRQIDESFKALKN